MSQALNRANISADLINKYNVVFIGSKVRKQEGQGGRSYYQHPLDPLLKPRESVLFIGTQFSNLYTAVDTPAKGRVGSDLEV
jgi:hypothetical protein